MERHISKEGLISVVRDLNGIIDNINYGNCYDMVVKFFSLTSQLDDLRDEIKKLPIKHIPVPRLRGFVIFGRKSNARKRSEAARREVEDANKRIELRRDFFIKEVHKAGRDPYGRNRTEPGESVTKHNVYFGGNIGGINTCTVAEFESSEDDYVRALIRGQIVDFVQSYKDSFRLDWLR